MQGTQSKKVFICFLPPISQKYRYYWLLFFIISSVGCKEALFLLLLRFVLFHLFYFASVWSLFMSKAVFFFSLIFFFSFPLFSFFTMDVPRSLLKRKNFLKGKAILIQKLSQEKKCLQKDLLKATLGKGFLMVELAG